jgi:hypothetical protein
MDELDPANYTMKPPKSAPQMPPAAPKAFIPDLTDDQLRKLAREQLSKALQHVDPIEQPEMTRKLCAELMDRLDGKPGQAITMDANLRVVTVNANIEFIQSARDKVIEVAVDKMQVIDN